MAWFNFLQGNADATELPDIFPFSLKKVDFTRADLIATYVKILTDTFERTHGLKEKYEPTLFDNCLQSENNNGLISMLAKAMAEKQELFMVYVPSVNILRVATQEEKNQIKADYEKNGESKTGVYVSFKNYRRTEMLAIYSDLEYCTLSSLHKGLNISKAIQLKFAKMRDTTSLQDSAVVKAQAKQISESLRDGKDIYLDAGDEVTTTTPDITPTEKAINFLDAKRAYILGFPLSYFSGEQTSGIGSTGEADAKAVDRGLKQYYFSIVKPVLKALFNAETDFKSQDFGQLTVAIEFLKTADLVTDEYMSAEAKTDVIRRLFELRPEDEEKALKKEEKEREKEEEENPEAPQVDAPPAGNGVQSKQPGRAFNGSGQGQPRNRNV